MSWLQGGWFVVVSGYSHLWQSKQHYRTWIICKKGMLTQASVFCYCFWFYFCGHFWRNYLDYKIAVCLACGFSLRLAMRGIIKLAGRPEKGRWCEEVPCLSRSPFQSPLSSRYQLRLCGSKSSNWTEAISSMHNPEWMLTISYWPISAGGETLGNFWTKVSQNTCSGSFRGFLVGP